MNKTDNTIKELKSNIEELKKEFTKKAKKLDKDKKVIAEEIVDKAINVINYSIKKITILVKTVKDDDKLCEILDTIKAKSKETVDFASAKLDDLINKTPKDNFEVIYGDIMDEFDKFKESDLFKSTKVFVKEGYDKLNEFLEKPEVQEKIKKAKAATIKYAEIGVEGLKKVLETDNTNKKKTTKKVAKKTTKKAAKKTTKPAAKKTTKKTTKTTTKKTK